MEPDTDQNRELLYKVLVVGDVGVGKTCIIKRYVHNIFSEKSKSTIGVDFGLKVIRLDSNTNVRIQLWDISGADHSGSAGMTRLYYKEAVGALIVFDSSRPNTLDIAKKWKSDIDSKVSLPNSDQPIPIILIANKIDLNENWGKTPEELDKFCSNNNFEAWFETSAKNNIGIELAMNKLVESIMSKVELEPESSEKSDMGTIQLNPPTPQSKCCAT